MVTCRSCAGTRLARILDLGLQPWGNDFIPIQEKRDVQKYPLELFFCWSCALIQIGHTIPKERMFTEHLYFSGTTRSLRAHFERVAAGIMARTDLAGGMVLDVGGNDGTFLQSFVQKGIRVINVDSGRRQAERSRQNGVFCVQAFFNRGTARLIRADHGAARVVHGAGIFFHLEELQSAFEGVRDILESGGLLVVEFIYLPEMIRKCAFDQIYHEHLLYYSLTTLGRILESHGLEIFDCEFPEIHGGSCIAYAGHPGGQPRTPALREALGKEVTGGFLEEAVYRDFAERTLRLRDKLTAMIRALRREGKTIQTLGAPVKGSTIVNFCGLTEQDIECATEINETKCGTTIPGTRIPVLHQDRTPPPDVYFLLSWNFKEEILSRLTEFRARGGKILVPIPEPELI
jgi:SAM-dependent methyltransferase